MSAKKDTQYIDELNNLKIRLVDTIASQNEGQKVPRELQMLFDDLVKMLTDIQLGEREWRDAFDAVLDPVFLHDKDCRIRRANAAYAQLAGMPLLDVIGRYYWEIFPKREGPLTQCIELQESQTDDSKIEEIRLESGESYLSRGFAARDAHGKYLYSVHILEDVTRERQLQAALSESAESYRTLFNSAPDAILLADAESGQLIDVNSAAEKLTGRSRENLLGLHQSQLHPKNSAAIKEFREAVQAGRLNATISPSEIPVLHADGHEIMAEVRGQVFELNGKPVIQGIFRDISARKEVEARLREQAQILAQIHDAVISTDMDGIITNWNQGAEHLLGYSESEALGKHVSTLYLEEDHAFVTDHIIRPLKESGACELDVRLRRKSGEVFEAQLSLSLLKDEQGVSVGMIGYALDISQRKSTERALHDSEETFRTISSTAQDAVVLLDDEGKIVYWNPSAERIFGYQAKEVIGKNLHRLLAPARYRATHEQAWALFQSSGEGPIIGKVVELAALHQDGSEFPIELSVSSVRIRHRWHAVGFLRDISERKQAEEKLRETGDKLNLSLSLLKAVLESVPIRVFWKDKELRYLGCNTLFAKDAGLSSSDELIGKTDFDMTWKDQAELYHEDDRNVMASGIPNLGYEEPQTTPDGKIIWLRTSKVPLRNEAQEVIGILGIYDDITAQKKVEKHLVRSESRLREAQAVAHLGSWELNLVKNELWWSDENHRIFGIEPGEKNNYETFLNTVHPEDRAVVNQVYKASVENHTPFDIEHRLLMADGSVKWVYERCKTYYADDGTPIRSSGTTMDITERHNANERLRQSEAGLAEAQRIARLGNWEYDIVNDHTSWSQEVYSIFEVDPEQFEPSYDVFIEAIHPDDRKWVDQAYRYSVENKTPFEVTHRLLMQDGRIKYVHELCENHYDENEQPLRSLGTMQDITEQYLTAQELSRSNRALKALSSCNSVLVHATDEAELLNNMCAVIINEGGYRFAWIGIVENDESKALLPVAHAGVECGYLEHIKVNYADNEYGRGPAGCAVRHARMQVVHDTQTDPNFLPWRETAAECGFHSVISLPLKNAKDQVFAVFSIYSGESHAFDKAALKLLQELSDDLAFGILSLRTRTERDHYLQEHLKSDERYKKMLVDTIRAMSLTVEKRDPYTAGHQHKVAQLSVAIGQELGMDEDHLEGLRLGATIHDIGKIYVPAEILNRPGRLSNAEFEIIKSHAEVGYDIIKDVHFPWPVAEMVIQHHERMDGSGYPKGLKGEEIILEARILAVADVVEAITSHRPYRAAKGMDKAINEIEANRGTLYDDKVAEICLHLIRDERFTFSEETW